MQPERRDVFRKVMRLNWDNKLVHSHLDKYMTPMHQEILDHIQEPDEYEKNDDTVDIEDILRENQKTNIHNKPMFIYGQWFTVEEYQALTDEEKNALYEKHDAEHMAKMQASATEIDPKIKKLHQNEALMLEPVIPEKYQCIPKNLKKKN